MSVENITLNNGQTIPPLGLGTYEGKNLETVIKASVDIGYRLIDTAFVYKNEDAIGKALKAVFEEGKVKREDLFIISKLWNTKHDPKDVLPAIKKSLQDLQIDYVDLYLIHWPLASKAAEEHEIFKLSENTNVTIEDTWRAMEELVKQGYTKSIGLSNFNSKQIERILKIATIKPVVNEVECNPYLSQEKLRAFCKEKGIEIIGYSPFYAPGRTGAVSHGLNVFEEPIIKKLAEKYKKSAGQIILRYLIQCQIIPIPKSDKVDRLKSNLDVFNFTLSPEDFEQMKSLNKNLRSTTFPNTKKFKEYPFNIEF